MVRAKYWVLGFILVLGCDQSTEKNLYSEQVFQSNNHIIRKHSYDYQLAICYGRIQRQDSAIAVDTESFLKNCIAELLSSTGDMNGGIVD